VQRRDQTGTERTKVFLYGRSKWTRARDLTWDMDMEGGEAMAPARKSDFGKKEGREFGKGNGREGDQSPPAHGMGSKPLDTLAEVPRPVDKAFSNMGNGARSAVRECSAAE
jgi:hypothetical protein